MGARINTNIGALNALKSLNSVESRLSTAQLRLATGKRINHAADDAAGYSIAKKFNVTAQGLGQALDNIGSAKNLITVAEGHLNNIVDILTQMKVKTIQAADDSLGTAERMSIKGQIVKLNDQINLEVNQAKWNNKSIFSGAATTGASSASGMFRFQIGAGSSSTNDTLKFDLLSKANVSFDSGAAAKGFTAAGLNVTMGTGALAGSMLGSSASALIYMNRIDVSIGDVSEALSYIGSVVNRLTYQETSLTVARTNAEAARSRIEDADMAYEQLEATKLQILQQTATAMLAQANTGPEAILTLFK